MTVNHELIDSICQDFPGCEVSSPFGPDTIVYKVEGKMFALLSLKVARLNVKCDPAVAESLREEFSAVEPGFHMNKKHWNSIYWEREELKVEVVNNWIAMSYDLVVSSLSKKSKVRLGITKS